MATLEWRDVHLERQGGAVVGGAIRLRASQSKTKRGREVPLRDGRLLELIARRAELRGLDCPLVFHRGGRPLRDFRDLWQQACAAVGMPGRLFHDLRRSAVRNMVRAGVPERVAMALSGHRTRSAFDRYNIVSEADVAAAVERTSSYVARRAEEERTVVPLAAAGGGPSSPAAAEHGENTESRGPSVSRAGQATRRNSATSQCRGRESNPHAACAAPDFKCFAAHCKWLILQALCRV